VSGKIPGPLGSAHPAITPFQSFRGADGKWIITPIGNDSLWKKFCSAIGREDLTDHPLYSTNPLRTRNREALIAILEEEFLKKPADEWLQIMDAHGLPNSPLNTIDRVVGDPNINYRKMIVSMEQPHVGTMKVVGSPFHMTQTPGAVRTPAPLLGQHTTDYLEDELGYSKIIIRDLIAEGVIFSKD
ncbi:MAG: CoA transferase, partial [Spirochaetales bacterium]|nr:CoA transferase [Spirochaetales bacterium]